MSPLSIVLTLLLAMCAGGGVASECPIECFCDTVTVSTTCDGGDGGLAIPLYYPNETSSRISLHSYKSPPPSDIQRLLLIPIRELSLSRNDLVTFPAVNSSSLTLLDLSHNSLFSFSTHPGGLLPSLRELDLSHNQISRLDSLVLPLLETINLSHNRLDTLHPSTFAGMRFLQYVNLDSNVLTSVPSITFSSVYLPSLAHLILSNNSELSHTTLAFTSPVQFLDLSHSGITYIPPSTSRAVRDLRATNNGLTTVPKQTFDSYPNLALLVLDDNPIDWVENGTFTRLTYLTRLWMNNNRLQRLPYPLPPALESLHLEDNLVTVLAPSDFVNLPFLSDLNLHGNKISSLSPYVFASLGSSLTSLDLRNNKINALLAESFANLSALTTLDLSLNPIKVFHTGTFASLRSSLTLLRLSRLKETSLTFDPTSLLAPLSSLEVLELDGSPALAASLLRDHGFAHCSSLRELHLEHCELDDLLITAAAFVDHLPRLERVRLEGNDWDCSDFLVTSESQETHEELKFLLKRPGVLADAPTCASPPNLKGLSFYDAKNSSSWRSRGNGRLRLITSSTDSSGFNYPEDLTSTPSALEQLPSLLLSNFLTTVSVKTTATPVTESRPTLVTLLSTSTVAETDVDKDGQSLRISAAWKQPREGVKVTTSKTEWDVVENTLMIAGVTVIMVTLFVLAVGGVILYYRNHYRHSGSSIIKSCQRKHETAEKESIYSRFSSDDQVELSGISNRLYSEANQLS